MRGFVRSLSLLGLVIGLVLTGSSLAPVAVAAVAPGVTKVDTAPDPVTSDRTAALTFSTTQLGAAYECKLVQAGGADPGWSACGTPAVDETVAPAPGSTTYPRLALGAYTFSVRATTPSGDGSPAVQSVPATTSWTVVAAPVVTIDSTPGARTGAPKPTWTFSSDQQAVSFSCSFTAAGAAQSFQPCGVAVDGTGSYVAAPTKAGPHVFAVRATSAVGAQTGPTVQDDVTILCSIRTTVCGLTAPGAYSVPAGAKFNNPLGSYSSRRRLLNHVTDTVKAMPGFVVDDPSYCSDDPLDYPSTIRISLYSVTSTAFARAMVAADRRCISAQIIMNNHLDPATTVSIQTLRDGLGTSPSAGTRSFAMMCGLILGGGGGCRGGGVLHSKFYLFDTTRKAPTGSTTIDDVVMVGSSNLTGNATDVQWNNLLTVRDNPTLHAQYLKMFNLMKTGQRDSTTYDFRTGSYVTQFWPRASGDPEVSALSTVRCTGVRSGAGYHGRTIVYVNMHAWFGTRGYALAKQVRGLYDRGCYVRILYSFMSASVFKKLKSGTSSRMAVRRTLFSTDGDKYADVYSHSKVIAVSGNVSGNGASRVTWTGSMNFTNNGVTFDEVMMRVSSSSVFAAYRDNWNYINKRKTSGTWATFEEPIGGGRPEPKVADARRMVQPTTPPTVLPPHADDEGMPLD